MDEKRIKSIIESLVFISKKPVTPRQLAVILNVSTETIDHAVGLLKEEYSERGVRIFEVAGGFLFATPPENSYWVKEYLGFLRKTKLSQAALETLSIIAYKQPIIKVDMEAIRGVNCDGVMKTLLDKKLVKIVGRSNIIGRPFLYGTTIDFLIKFGLKSITDLPDLKEIEKLLSERQKEPEGEVKFVEVANIPEGSGS